MWRLVHWNGPKLQLTRFLFLLCSPLLSSHLLSAPLSSSPPLLFSQPLLSSYHLLSFHTHLSSSLSPLIFCPLPSSSSFLSLIHSPLLFCGSQLLFYSLQDTPCAFGICTICIVLIFVYHARTCSK